VHPFGDLSAYLDGALSPEARASVQAHLDTCALCRTRLAELRGTARLIAALPMPVPSRSLVPRVSAPVWMVALRRFSTVASAAAIFLFVVSAAMSSFPRTQSAGTAPAAAPAPTAALDAARSGGTSGSAAPQSADDRQKYAAPTSASASPGAAFNVVPSPTPAPAAERTTTSDATGRQDVGSAAPSASIGDFAVASRISSGTEQPPVNPFPWLWLVLGIAFAAVSFILGRRLRSA
jgi:anti-sigma factor RsiW